MKLHLIIGWLQLVRPVFGPIRYQLQMQMNVVTSTQHRGHRRQITTRYLTFVTVSVSSYDY